MSSSRLGRTSGTSCHPVVVWTALLASAAIAACMAFLAAKPPAPLPADAPADRFAEGRAFKVLRMLTDDVGVRVNGTAAHAHAAELLAAELRRVPRLEVEVQQIGGAKAYANTRFPYPVFAYKTLNVIARLKGRSADSILLNAHFDTAGDSVGAGDDAVGVATMVEVARVLAREPMLDRSIVLNLNGGEEHGFYGASGFLQHRFAKDVRAYIYIDGSGGGKATLLGALPPDPWLVKTYAKAVPQPWGSSTFQDFLASNLLGHDGDHRPLGEAGIPGVLLAPIGDMGAIHTERDRADRVQPGTLQHCGDSTLALARALATGPAPRQTNAPRMLYYDVLGLFMVTYSVGAARALTTLAWVLAGIALTVAARRRLYTPGRVPGALVWTALSLLAGLLAAMTAALLLSFVLRRPHGWYHQPWLVVPSFGAAALAGMLAVQALGRSLRRHDQNLDEACMTAWAAILVGWSLFAAFAALTGLGIGYLTLWSTVSLSVGMLAATRWPERRMVAAIGSTLPVTLLAIGFGGPALQTFMDETGFLMLPIPSDILVATMVALTCLTVVVSWIVPAQACGALRQTAGVVAVIAVLGIALLAAQFPWSGERPRRLLASHREQNGKSALLLRPMDALPMGSILSGIPEAKSAQADWLPFAYWAPKFTHELPADSPPYLPPRVEILSTTANPEKATRTVELRLFSDAPMVYFFIPQARLVSLSLLEKLPPVIAQGDRDVITFDGIPADGWPFQLELAGADPVEIELHAEASGMSAELTALLKRLPNWVVLWPASSRIVRSKL